MLYVDYTVLEQCWRGIINSSFFGERDVAAVIQQRPNLWLAGGRDEKVDGRQ